MFTKESLTNLKTIYLYCSDEWNHGYFVVLREHIIDIKLDSFGVGYIEFSNDALEAPYVDNNNYISNIIKLTNYFHDIDKISFNFNDGTVENINIECNHLISEGVYDYVIEYSNCCQMERLENSFKLIFGGAKRIDNNYFDLVYGLDKVLSKRRIGSNVLKCDILYISKSSKCNDMVISFKVLNEGYSNKKIRILFNDVNFNGLSFNCANLNSGTFNLYMSKSAFENKVYVSISQYDDYEGEFKFECSRMYSLSSGGEAQNAYIRKFYYDPSLFLKCLVEEEELVHLFFLSSDILGSDVDEKLKIYKEDFLDVVSLYRKRKITSSYLGRWLSILPYFLDDDFELENGCDIYSISNDLLTGKVSKKEAINKLYSISDCFEEQYDSNFYGVIMKSDDHECMIKEEDIVSFTINGMDYRDFLPTGQHIQTYELVLNEPVTFAYLELGNKEIVKVPYSYSDFKEFEIRLSDQRYVSNDSLWLGSMEFKSYSQELTYNGKYWVYSCDMNRKPTYFSNIDVEMQVKDVLNLPYSFTLTDKEVSNIESFYFDECLDLNKSIVDDLMKMPNLRTLHLGFIYEEDIDTYQYMANKLPNIETISIGSIYEEDIKCFKLFNNLKKLEYLNHCYISDKEKMLLPIIHRHSFSSINKNYKREYDGLLNTLNKCLNHNLISRDQYNEYKNKAKLVLDKILLPFK